jgi:hypothetical protein
MMHPRLAPVLALVVLLGGCTTPTVASAPTAPSSLPDGVEPSDVVDGVVRTTSGDQTGNRVTAGTLDLATDPLRVELGAEPVWIVGGPVGPDTSVYVVVAADGSVSAITVDESGPAQVPLDRQDSDTPPVAVFGEGGYRLITAPAGASVLTAPALVGSVVASITVEGEMTVGDSTVVDVLGLGDSRLAVDERGLVAVLSDPTSEYPHGVVGDRVESVTVTIVDAESGDVVGVAVAPEGTVFETVAPLWGDVDGDGDTELVVTASNGQEGARLVVYDERGRLVASSAPIGRGQRWRNQLGVADFDGGPAIIDVQTPHIGGIVQWFRIDGDELVRVAAAAEYSTHRIGRRNLDQGVIVDGDGDGVFDVVVPSQNQQLLSALRLDGGEVTEVRSIPLGSRLATNLSAFTTPDGGASMAFGLEDGSVLIWP